MEPGTTSEGGCAWIAKREGGCAVREHGALAIGLDHHHDAGAAAAAL
jgi:hypothetical protein